MPTIRRLFAVLLVGALALAACGGDDDDGGSAEGEGDSSDGSTINVPPIDLRSLGEDEENLLKPLALAPKGIWLGPKDLRLFYQVRQNWRGECQESNPGMRVKSLRFHFGYSGFADATGFWARWHN